ncbi:MAG: hypothetical protein EOO59_10505, partial [Hymenobacter sp.]
MKGRYCWSSVTPSCRARLLGGEATLDFHPHPLDWLHFENSFSMVRARQLGVTEDQQYLPFIPADRLQ